MFSSVILIPCKNKTAAKQRKFAQIKHMIIDKRSIVSNVVYKSNNSKKKHEYASSSAVEFNFCTILYFSYAVITNAVFTYTVN